MSFQILVNGLATGSVYALIATGFAMVYDVLKFSNFSHGAMMTSGAFLGYFLAAGNGYGLFLTIIISVLSGGLIGLLGEFIAFKRILANHSSSFYFFVSSITLGTLYEGIITLKVGANFYNYPRFFENPTIKIFNIIIAKSDTLMFVISVIALLLLGAFLQYTKQGRAVRSVSFDRETASLMGINVNNIILVTFFISGCLAGLAGVFLGINYTLYPTLGGLVVKGFIAAVIGGLGSIVGAIIGAFLLGIIETIFIYLVGSGYAPIFTFLIMLIFLLIRPRGIAGSNIQEKA